MNGYLLVNKPKGMSSFDVIRQLRPLTNIKKIGHAGTLDPLAEGLMILLFGKATKQQDKFMKQDKTYTAEITLGHTSPTDDAEGLISNKQEAISKKPGLPEIKKVLQTFEGEQMQVPPQFSAIKVNGKRAYRAARQGKTTELAARPVKIHKISLIGYEYPILNIEARVGSGTYIRSLARDIGAALGTGAYLSGLVRTQVGTYRLEDALDINNATYEDVVHNLRPLKLI